MSKIYALLLLCWTFATFLDSSIALLTLSGTAARARSPRTASCNTRSSLLSFTGRWRSPLRFPLPVSSRLYGTTQQPPTEGSKEQHQQSLATNVSLDTVAWILPPIVSIVAFQSYDSTRKLFHSCIDAASGHTWTSADGGMFMASLIRPLLNGPVTLSLSILFGTLVAMTIQTLYNRQVNIHKMLVGSVEEMRELSLYLCGFPEPHRRQGRLYLESYLTLNMRAVHENSFSPVSLRSQSEMGSFLLMLNAMSGNKGSKDDGSLVVEPPAYLSEVYTSVHRLKVIRSELTSTLFSAFPWFHYANMVILAAALLFVFLLETDQEAMQFLVGFQLSLCWALLIGTYAMLGVVMYDLATPFTGFFSVVKGSANDRNQTRSYALALDLASTHPDDS